MVNEILLGALLTFCYVYTCITYSRNTFKMSTAGRFSEKGFPTYPGSPVCPAVLVGQ